MSAATADSIANLNHQRLFSICGYRALTYSKGVTLFAILNAIGGTGQAITLPLFLSTFGNYAGAYFVLFLCSTCFVVFFGVGTLVLRCRGLIPDREREFKWHRYYLACGMCDATSGLFVVFSSFLGRVSGPMGSILNNLLIPFTLVFSRLFGVGDKEYARMQKVALFLILVAVILGLTPLFARLASGEAQAHPQAWWWPLMLILGIIPGALMTVTQDACQNAFKNEAEGQSTPSNPMVVSPTPSTDSVHVALVMGSGSASISNGKDKRISVLWFQFWESLYQFIAFVLCFWVDLIPGFGFNTNLDGFWHSFSMNWKCFLSPQSVPLDYSDRCTSSAPLGLLFIASYILSYVSSTELTNYASANTASTISCASPIATVLFWTLFPSVNKWAGGDPMEAIDIGCSLAALVPLVFGLVWWRRYEKSEAKTPGPDEFRDGIELCCVPPCVASSSPN